MLTHEADTPPHCFTNILTWFEQAVLNLLSNWCHISVSSNWVCGSSLLLDMFFWTWRGLAILNNSVNLPQQTACFSRGWCVALENKWLLTKQPFGKKKSSQKSVKDIQQSRSINLSQIWKISPFIRRVIVRKHCSGVFQTKIKNACQT